MSAVEAAASLFGPEEFSDPFATLGSEAGSLTSPSIEDHGATAFDNVLGSGDYTDISLMEEVPTATGTNYSETAALDHRGYHDPPNHSDEMNTASETYAHPQGWYDEHGQHMYEQQPSEMPSSDHGHADIQDYSAASNPYDPYAPQASNVSTSHGLQHATRTQAPYDAYNPSAQTSSHAYDPQANLVAQNTYSPPKPATSNYQQYSVPQVPAYPYSTPPAASVTQLPAIPPPPAHVAPLNRPKPNAYDPPFAASKSAKRATRSVPPAATAYGQQLHSVHGSVAATPTGYQNASYVRGADNNMTIGSSGWVAPHTGSSQYSGPSGANYGEVPDTYSNRDNDRIHLQSAHHMGSYAPATWTPPSDRPTSDLRSQLSQRPPPSNAHSHTHTGFSHSPAGLASVRTGSHSMISSSAGKASHPPPIPEEGIPASRPAPYSSPFQDGPTRATSTGSWQFVDDSHQGDDYAAFQTKFAGFSSQLEASEEPSEPSNSTTYIPNAVEKTRVASPRSTSLPDAGNSQPHSNHRQPGFMVYPPDLNGHSGPQRMISPGSVSPDSLTSSPDLRQIKSRSADTDKPPPTVHSHRENWSASPDPYAPKTAHPLNNYDTPVKSITDRMAPPTDYSRPGVNMYSPPMGNGSADAGDIRNRSMSSPSAYSAVSSSVEDLYAAFQRPHPDVSDDMTRRSFSSVYDAGDSKAPTTGDPAFGQDLLVGVVTQTPYAPSPSLLGSNDPLGRATARVPVISFGFGGKVVTCFHGSSVLNTGFDVALASRRSMDVTIRVLSKFIPDSALYTSTTPFPGPLFSDPGSPTVSLVRTGNTAKAKKTRVVKYLAERAEEISQGIGYLQPGTADRRKAEGKLILVKLLKVMVENDGSVSGTPQIDLAVRTALIPRLEKFTSSGSQDSTPALGFSVPADMHSSMPNLSSISYPGRALPPSTSHEIPIAVSTLRSSTLDKIQEFLLRGERQQAYHFALDEKLWAHAMVIASSIDREAWKEVVNEFIKSELGGKPSGQVNGAEVTLKVGGRESLRVAYSMFSGQGAAAVQELVLQHSLANVTAGPQVPAPPPHFSPLSASFSAAAPPQVANVPAESLSKWAESAAMIFSSPMTLDTSSALTALGDCLLANQWIEAAHVCYLLAPQTSPIGGIGMPGARIILLGSPNPTTCPNFHKDPDSIIFTEIAEFALSLLPPTKGQETFNGLPHLQAYRLVRAASLAEVGQVQQASRYCEAITGALNRSSPYFTAPFVEQLKWFSDRIVGAPHLEKSGSWIGGKMSKPSLDSIGTWLEGRFTKLITGDPSPLPTEHAIANEDRTFGGPFSHYSTISSATSSASPSPQPSVLNLNALPPPRRPGSAMAYPLPNPSIHIDRASSAMDHIRPKPSPTPRISSANVPAPTSSQFPSPANTYSLNTGLEMQTPKLSPTVQQNESQSSAWWGSSYEGDASSQTPTAASFLRVDDVKSASSSGFISLMDNEAFPVALSRDDNHAQAARDDEEDIEDLGFGNPLKREKPPAENEMEKVKAPPPADKAEPAKPAPAQSLESSGSTGSWFSRFGLWGKREGTGGPVKANLGEEKSFYYDKELKRWVNKAEAQNAPKAADPPPPPPARAQTASPGKSGAAFLPNGGSNSGPPARPASVDSSSSQPPKSTTRSRSNLVPKEPEATGNMPATPPLSGGTPPARPRSQAAKRNIRSRYVDVLQQ